MTLIRNGKGFFVPRRFVVHRQNPGDPDIVWLYRYYTEAKHHSDPQPRNARDKNILKKILKKVWW